MGFLKKILGKGGDATPTPGPGAPPPPAADPASDPNLIRVFDAYGRELFLTREQWRDGVLLGNLEKAKADPEALGGMIARALEDGFGKDVLPFAEHLHRTDPIPARGATLLAVVYLALDRVDEAERVLREHVARHGEDAYVLTNLAKAQDRRGDRPLAEATLWRALELDPNQENGFAWYAATQRERHGETGFADACRRVAALPASWRAQLWLAREALKRGDLAAACALYEESLARAGAPTPAELLMQVSGDLGNAGRLDEILSLVSPRFDAALHGLAVGNNLIKANVDLGRLDEARRIVDALYAQGRPDWRQHLEFWSAELAKARVGATQPSPAGPAAVVLLSIEGPLWLRDASPCAGLAPGKRQDAPRIAFFGATTLMPRATSTPHVQLADGPGRLSRALPLVLAEHVHLGTDAAGVALIPWADGHGFAVFGHRQSDEDLRGVARASSAPLTIIGGVTIDASGSDWAVSLRLLRAKDGAHVGSAEVRANPNDPAPAVEELLGRVGPLLREAGIGAAATPPWYARPARGHGSNYLLRLEQQLATTCEAMDEVKGGALSGEHEILDGVLHLCLAEPGNPTPRLLLAQTLRQMKKARPAIVAQYEAHAARLQREHPLGGEAGACVAKALGEVFAPA